MRRWFLKERSETWAIIPVQLAANVWEWQQHLLLVEISVSVTALGLCFSWPFVRMQISASVNWQSLQACYKFPLLWPVQLMLTFEHLMIFQPNYFATLQCIQTNVPWWQSMLYRWTLYVFANFRYSDWLNLYSKDVGGLRRSPSSARSALVLIQLFWQRLLALTLLQDDMCWTLCIVGWRHQL